MLYHTQYNQLSSTPIHHLYWPLTSYTSLKIQILTKSGILCSVFCVLCYSAPSFETETSQSVDAPAQYLLRDPGFVETTA